MPLGSLPRKTGGHRPVRHPGLVPGGEKTGSRRLSKPAPRGEGRVPGAWGLTPPGRACAAWRGQPRASGTRHSRRDGEKATLCGGWWVLFAKRLGSCPPQGQSQHSGHSAPHRGRGRLMDACHLVPLGQGDWRGWSWTPCLHGPGDPPGRRGCSRVPTSLRRGLGRRYGVASLSEHGGGTHLWLAGRYVVNAGLPLLASRVLFGGGQRARPFQFQVIVRSHS